MQTAPIELWVETLTELKILIDLYGEDNLAEVVFRRFSELNTRWDAELYNEQGLSLVD